MKWEVGSCDIHVYHKDSFCKKAAYLTSKIFMSKLPFNGKIVQATLLLARGMLVILLRALYSYKDYLLYHRETPLLSLWPV